MKPRGLRAAAGMTVALALLAAFMLLPLAGLATGALWLPLAVSFGLLPLADAAVGRGRPGRPTIDLPAPAARWLPRAGVPLQAGLLLAATAAAPTLSPGQCLLFALGVGTMTGGIGITLAHELGHRASRLDRWLARLLLVSVGYGHFYVEHNRGHHARVATAADPASAPRGMTVYRFIVRSVLGGLRHAWHLEALRLRQRGLPVLHPSNWVLTGSVAAAVLPAGAWAAWGAQAALFLLAQSAAAVALLEIVNYIEHYGLRRHRQANGRVEPVSPQHSWNADFVLSNWLLLNLQLHSDHHAHVDRPFEALRSLPQAPQLPAGYPTLVPVALVPPLWFALIHPRLRTAAAAAPA